MQKENNIDNLTIEQLEEIIKNTKKDIFELKKSIYKKSKFIIENINNN